MDDRDAVNAAIFHVRAARTLNAIVSRGVPDLLGDGPLASAELASLSGLHPLSLERSLRMLAGFGVFTEASPGVFANNDASELLRDRPGGLRNWALFATSRYIWDAMAAADHAVSTGESAFVHAHARSIWEHLRANPEDDAVFNAMFAELWGGGQQATVAAEYDWGDDVTVVDVGGGNGSLLATILEANPRLRGVVFDQPAVIEQAEPHLAARGVRSRCELVPGDFFERIPVVGDVWVLSQILHDWDDERSEIILDRCRAQLRDGDRLLVVELLTVPCEPDRLVGLTDVNMLVLFGEARQRTEVEYRALFERHRLALTRVLPTTGGFSVIEARPV